MIAEIHFYRKLILNAGILYFIGVILFETSHFEMLNCIFCRRLPTMSIEEAGLKEMEMMNNWQERNARLMEEANSSWYKDNRKPKPGEGEEDDEDDDAAQDKARAWDDWKDDNPRGAGNKKLTPCG